jgi:hypothetical protein
VRALDERAKRGDLAAAVGDARATAAGVDAAEHRVSTARTALDAALHARDALHRAGAIALADRFVARRRRELASAIDDELRARAAHAGRLQAIDLARERLSSARAHKELIERHFARWRDARRKLADRRAE